jgi:hypothetical protein
MLPNMILQKDSRKDEKISNFLQPSNRTKEKENQFSRETLKLRNLNYVSVIKKESQTPLLTARSNASFEDTPRAVPHNRAFAAYQGPQRKPELENFRGNANHNSESALEHWLSDTQGPVKHNPAPDSLDRQNQPEHGKPRCS